MKVSTRVEYGMLALADIAIHSEGGTSVSAPDIAERQDISRKYLEQILTHLRQAGLINAQKGLKGGYPLSRPAGMIRLSDFPGGGVPELPGRQLGHVYDLRH